MLCIQLPSYERAFSAAIHFRPNIHTWEAPSQGLEEPFDEHWTVQPRVLNVGQKTDNQRTNLGYNLQ